MARWFRHYAGMVRDEKLVAVALRAKQSIERVVWVWSAILESAAEINQGGNYEVEPAELAHFLRCEEKEIDAILGALRHKERITKREITNWKDRQYQSDISTDRVKRHREKNQRETKVKRFVKRSVKQVETFRNASETETETDPETDPDPDQCKQGDPIRSRSSPNLSSGNVRKHPGDSPLADALESILANEPQKPVSQYGSGRVRGASATPCAFSLTPAGLSEALNALEPRPTSQTARNWNKRIEQMGEHEGGLRAVSEFLKRIQDSDNPTKDVGRFKSPAAWVNQQTSNWLKSRQKGKTTQ